MTLAIKANSPFQFFMPPLFPSFPLLMELDYSFLEAAKKGDASTIKNCLKQKPNSIDVRDEHGKTALHYAAEKGEEEVIQILLTADADPHIVDSNGNTALHLAIENGYFRTAEILLNEDAKLIHIANSFGETPLHFAAKKNYFQIAEILLLRNANPNIQNSVGETPFFIAMKNNYKKTIWVFLQYTPFIQPILLNTTIFHYASFVNDPSVIKIFERMDLNSIIQMTYFPDEKGRYPLHLAAHHGNLFMMNLLLNVGGANVDYQDAFGNTALHLAVQSGNREAVHMLLNRGARQDILNKEGNSPLDFASGREDIKRLLMKRDRHSKQ